MELSEQVVLVSGGGRGLGSYVARAFLREGARVVVGYRRSEAGAREVAALAPDRAVALPADVTSRAQVRDQVRRAAEALGGPVTTVVSNALPDYSFNGDGRARADSVRWADLAAQVEGAVRGTLHCVQECLPGMRAAGEGVVVTIGSNLVHHPVVPYHDYTAAKAALLGLTRTLAADLGPEGVRVNMVAGGLLRTTDASAATPPEVFDAIAAQTPLRRVVAPEELADAVVALASPWCRAVTGQELVVDGGLVMR
ncbi:3-oxoacyl-ACP reductase [Nocardioides litoris]|uniref:3-oxoacyl-ACP reductase n=1 Tax=Nocardioides litoris TaxID=1926648 RepID=UPI00111F7FC1|nr:3-oxoacyl-ACP reductase [Nocardioides litoris]